ncbi:CAP domain-containing protein [Variovorax sp. YR750]|uniref:CAP domain-containing protein n=1 Tax=Variovorax sp. YR750 TaxID=1884384 RepID=UPI000B865E90|nr:CAP domain-containing protein [Variovorax sp. YR750]
MNLRHTATATSVLATLLLASCGGGGGGGGGGVPLGLGVPAAPAPAPAPAPAAAPAPAPASALTALESCSLPDFAQDTITRVNQFRSEARTCGTTQFPAAAPLSWNPRLDTAAARQSNDMVAKNFFDHTGSDGSTVGVRVTDAGYAWSGVAENIAAGQTSVASAMNSWQLSEGHCRNLMGASYKHVALACVRGTSANAYPFYWTMVLATP